MGAISIIIKILNNFIYTVINYAPNKIIYNFKTHKTLNILNKEAFS